MWLKNVVMVKKSSTKWRICEHCTELNKVCPKDLYPLPDLNRTVDTTVDDELLSCMDTFLGYNHIKMYRHDEEKTMFATDQGVYCYRVMPFRLKNARATFQRLVNPMFKPLISKIMEVYVDDLLIKSLKTEDHVRDLRETFDILRKYN